MAIITWDDAGERVYETGIDHCVLYVYDALTSKYTNGVAWNGITAVTEKPGGAEPTPVYADNMKYLNLMSAETFAATIEAVTYPDEFMQCDGLDTLGTGLVIAGQNRKMFGLCYRSIIGNDEDGPEHGQKLHLVYGLTASPSEKAYNTVNESPEAIPFSWEVSSVPVPVAGKKPTSLLLADSRTVAPADWTTLTNKLYGAATAAELPLPDEILTLLA